MNNLDLKTVQFIILEQANLGAEPDSSNNDRVIIDIVKHHIDKIRPDVNIKKQYIERALNSLRENMHSFYHI